MQAGQAGAWADHPQVSDYLKKAAGITHSKPVPSRCPIYQGAGWKSLTDDLWADGANHQSTANHAM
jgi:hypothetical protein